MGQGKELFEKVIKPFEEMRPRLGPFLMIILCSLINRHEFSQIFYIFYVLLSIYLSVYSNCLSFKFSLL